MNGLWSGHQTAELLGSSMMIIMMMMMITEMAVAAAMCYAVLSVK
jgi:hypothetical protein